MQQHYLMYHTHTQNHLNNTRLANMQMAALNGKIYPVNSTTLHFTKLRTKLKHFGEGGGPGLGEADSHEGSLGVGNKKMLNGTFHFGHSTFQIRYKLG